MSVDITAVGDVNVDVLTPPIKSYPKKDRKITIPSICMCVGGGAANFSLATSRLGSKVKLIGLVGDDIFGNFVKRKIEEFEIENKLRLSGSRTGVSLGISFIDGSRSLISFPGTNSLFSVDDFDMEEIEGKLLHVSGYNILENLQKDVNKILSFAKKHGMLTSLEPDLKSGVNCDMNELKRNLSMVDFFFPDFAEGKLLTGKSSKSDVVKAVLKYGCKIVVLKCGKDGCVVGYRNGIFDIKGLKVESVNHTGAGDVFNAAFVHSYLKDGDLERAGVFANAAGALATTKFGEERFPTEKEVDGFIDEHEQKD